MMGSLLALSIDFGKEVYDGFNRILGIVGIVLLVLLFIGIVCAILALVTRVKKLKNQIKIAKVLRENKKRGK